MLRFDLVQHLQEHVVHLVAEVGELLRTQVGVVVDECLDLGPLHFLAVLVEEAALVLAVETGLTDQARLAAAWVGAEGEGWPAVDALRPVDSWLS